MKIVVRKRFQMIMVFILKSVKIIIVFAEKTEKDISEKTEVFKSEKLKNIELNNTIKQAKL